MNAIDSTPGLGEADRCGTNEDPMIYGATDDERAAYLAVLEWRRRNPSLPLECAFSRLGVDRRVYLAARKKAEAFGLEAFHCHSADLIRPGVGLLKAKQRKAGC